MSYIFIVVKFFSDLPFAVVTIPELPWWAVLMVYVIACGAVWRIWTVVPNEQVVSGAH
jgi:hypothetical protein